MGDRHSPGLDMMFKLGMPEYKNLLGVRGDNTPEHAKYLGYLDAKELYPDFKATPLETYIQEAIQNKMKPIYS
jgi:hypothetical protein